MRCCLRTLACIGSLLGLTLILGCGGSGGSTSLPGASPRAWEALPENPAFLEYLAQAEAGQELPELQPPRFSPDALAVVRGVSVPSPQVIGGICTFPAVYDLRTLGRITPARNSTGVCGTCWTASAIGSIESSVAPFEMRDFSEAHMQLRFGADTAACGQGGNRNIATFYVAGWHGPVDEADFDPSAHPPVRLAQQPEVRKHVQNVLWLPDREGPLDNCWIKLAVTNLGGVYSDISRANFSPHFTVNHTYYHPTAGSVHSVTIVGWDDNFDRNLFFCGDPSVPDAQRVPAGDGAFIVKDNGGPGWLDQGFFYVSYYDGSIGTSLAAFAAEPADNYSRNYQHDPYGPTNELVLSGQKKAASWQANVFTAQADEWLSAVGFYELYDDNMDFQVEIYLDPTSGPIAAGQPVATAHISLVMRGYYTVKLPQRVRLSKGQRFSVVLRGQERTGGWPSSIPIEQLDPYHSKVKAGPGQSYVSPDGNTWLDLTSVQVSQLGGQKKTLTNSNVCVKAFTTPLLGTTAQIASEDQAMTWQLVNEGAEAVWVKPAAILYENVGGVLLPLGGELVADYVQMTDGGLEDTLDGWILLDAGESRTALAQPGSASDADEVAYKTYYFEHVSGLIRASGAWQKLVNAFLQVPLQIVSTTPAQGATLNSPGGANVIQVDFDRPAKAGPNLIDVTVTLDGKLYSAVASVNGSRMTIFTAPFNVSQLLLGGSQVRVLIPSHAVLSQLGSAPLASQYEFTYVVFGVN